MIESALKRIEKKRKEHRRWIALILCLSMAVSLGIFSGLRKDAVAKTYTRVVLECPYMADGAAQVVHTHNDDCFDEYGNLVCTLPELEAHTHGDECFTEVRTLACGLEENPGHLHTDACYTAETSLICTLEENEGHQHTGDCYTLERGELLCDNTDEEHEHTDACFAWNEVLSCGMEAGEGAHLHSEDCYRTEWILTCGMEEGEGTHVHTDACYLTERVLSCDKPEIVLHTHTDDCYQRNDDGSIYVDEDGYSRLICGQPEIIEHVHDVNCFTVYELDDGEPDETDEAGEEIAVTDEITEEQAEAEVTDEAEAAEEETGAEENSDLSENEADVPAIPMPAQSFEKTAGGIRVSVEAPEGAFPENTRMSVRPVNGSGLVDTVSDAVNGEILEVQAVDITFYDVSDNEIEPATAIRVSIVPANSQYSEEKANVVHIDAAGEATAVEQAEGTEADNSEVVFDADSFSIYAIVYTVHFEYEVDGQVYTSTVPGAQDKLLSELIRELNIVSEEQFADFMTKIAEVSISNPEVLKITETEGDWTVRPLKDSEEEEALTIVMQDGATFRITVDAEGITEVRTEDETAVIRTVNDLYLPQDTTAVARVLTEEESGNAIAALQQDSESTEENDPETADEAVDAGTGYHAFSIGLENVDVENYDGFNVSVTLPEDAVVGRDFQLFQVQKDGSATEITETLELNSERNEDGLQAVSELSFTTDSFADYVLSYSIETYYTTYEGDSLKISLNYGPKAGIPEGAELKVREILPEDERYSDYLNDSVTELGVKSGAIAFARFLDIEIQKDGEKIEPLAPVSVKIQMMDLPEETGNAEAQVIHFGEQTEVLTAEAAGTDVSFETGSFSVYGVVYTVDFHYEVNGQTFEFSIPGGGFISLAHLIEALGINVSDATGTDSATDKALGEEEEYTESSAETATEEAAADQVAEVEAEADGEAEISNVDVDAAAAYEQAIRLNNIPVSEETRAFVAEIAAVEFSSPELVWTGKVEEESTIGALKEANGLEVEYSANLTEEQIAEINAQTVEAGDWALVSVRPFVSEESLTVTMENGDSFTIRVTDGQIRMTVIDAKGDTWEITVTYGDDAQIPDGAELKVEEILPDDEAYYEYYRRAIELVCTEDQEGNRHGFGRLFDISIWSGEKKIEPQSSVQVSIKMVDAPEDDNGLSVVHFGKNEPEVMALEKTPELDPLSVSEETEEKRVTELRFETDSFSLYAVVSTNTSDGYGLGGQKFAIVNHNNRRIEAVLGRSQENNTALAASEVTVQQISGQTYLVGEEVTVWEFESVNGNNNSNVYYIKAPNGQYMHVGNGTAYLSDTPQPITVSQSGNGLRLDNGGYGLNAWNRTVSQGFRAGTYNDDASKFALYSANELIQNQADKISLPDLIKLHNGDTPVEEVVIYTRILNQERDGYDYYAVAADGSLVPVYDIGDTIGWVSSNDTPEYLKWKFTVHSNDGEENGYFDFQSMESGLYLIPTEASGLKTDDPDDSWDLGVNMQGWNTGAYGSAIERWDTDSRQYAGYAYDAENNKIVPTTDDSQKLEFLFAHVKSDPAPNQLHEVDTLDGKTKGITIKMYDFDGSRLSQSRPPRSYEMTYVMGNGSVNSTNNNGIGYANRGLVSQTLTDGFPTATQTQLSLGNLFNDNHFKSDASNLFVQQVYDETGYFSYDSSVNYAYLDQGQGQDKFILYRELAAPAMEQDTSPSGNKGNFFPFDSLQDLANRNQVFTNRSVKYDGDLQEMTPDNPQYGETLYKIESGSTANNYRSYFFGMTMEAHFYQGPDGKDERGNDIIYEFNGDDDMWLYIDDRLVLDIGGCHGAVKGTINFATGVVRVYGSDGGRTTTLKQIFYDARKLPDGSVWTEEGAAKWFHGDTFADYTTHSFKMFYMERGSYASNLKMNFNLMTIEPGTFVLEKKLPEEVQAYGEQIFAYQIYTIIDDEPILYTPPEGKQVTYEKTGEAVPVDQEGNRGFKSTYTIGNQTYNNVYLLKPYEPIVIPTLSNDMRYFVREIGIDTDLYEIVKANGIVLQDTKQNPAIDPDHDLTTATTDTETVKARGRVTYENIPKETHNLRLEKLLQGPLIRDDDSFRFDVQLEDSVTGRLVPYYMGEYYIVKPDNNGIDQYYKYENGTLVLSSDPVVYKAGVSGSIDHIIPGYTVLITGLLPGTDFQVTENQSAGEYPEGYLYAGKAVLHAGSAEISGADGIILARANSDGSAEAYQDALVQITNTSGTDVSLIKVDRNDLNIENPNCLKGASFTLSKYTSDTFQSKDTSWGDNGSKILNDEKKPDGTFLLNGVFEFEQLTVGYYKIEETKLPAGYVKMTGDPTFKVELDAQNGFKITLLNNPDNLLRLEDNALKIIIGNTPGVELPNTGGTGTRLFSLFGGILVLTSGVVLTLRKRKTA